MERLETSPEFEWTQQLATTRKGGWDREVGWAADQAEKAAAEAEAAEAAGSPEPEADPEPSGTRRRLRPVTATPSYLRFGTG